MCMSIYILFDFPKNNSNPTNPSLISLQKKWAFIFTFETHSTFTPVNKYVNNDTQTTFLSKYTKMKFKSHTVLKANSIADRYELVIRLEHFAKV